MPLKFENKIYNLEMSSEMEAEGPAHMKLFIQNKIVNV